MSRYAILTEDENLEVFAGFDEGTGRFFLTIEDPRKCTGEEGTYIFHNMDHHPGVGMTLEEVVRTLARFGMVIPPELVRQLIVDATPLGMESLASLIGGSKTIDRIESLKQPAEPERGSNPIRIVGWASAV